MSTYPEVIGWVLDTDFPEFKMASLEGLGTPKEIAEGLISRVTTLYIFLA